MTREALETLPTSRQRHSLLAIGKSLVNLPDDPPASSDGAANRVAARFLAGIASSGKKRMTPDSGFGSPSVRKKKM